MAEIVPYWYILVENHYVGRLDGFRFTPDASSDGIHGKATRHAAAKVLIGELAGRAASLAAAPDEAITIKSNGRIVWAGSEIAWLEKGDTALKPRLQLFADEHLAASEREMVQKRLDAKLAAELNAKLAPLMALREASDLSGLARGLVYPLTEESRRAPPRQRLRGDQGARPGGPRPNAQIRCPLRRLQCLHSNFAQAGRCRSAADALGAAFRTRARPRCRHASRPPAARPHLGRSRQGHSRRLLAHRRLPRRWNARRAHRHAGAPVGFDPRAHLLAQGGGRRGGRRAARAQATAASAWCQT